MHLPTMRIVRNFPAAYAVAVIVAALVCLQLSRGVVVVQVQQRDTTAGTTIVSSLDATGGGRGGSTLGGTTRIDGDDGGDSKFSTVGPASNNNGESASKQRGSTSRSAAATAGDDAAGTDTGTENGGSGSGQERRADDDGRTAAAAPQLTAVLHVGPHKTASSALQCRMTYMWNELLKEYDFVYLGRQYSECRRPPSPPASLLDTRGLISCLDGDVDAKRSSSNNKSGSSQCQRRTAWKHFEKLLRAASGRGNNVVVSDEALSRMKVAAAAVGKSNNTNIDGNSNRTATAAPFNSSVQLLIEAVHRNGFSKIRVVIVYRRYYEWLLSMYNEKYKPLPRRERYLRWPIEKGGGGGGGKPLRTFVDYYRRLKKEAIKKEGATSSSSGYQLAAARMNVHPVEYLSSLWNSSSYSTDLVVFNMHDRPYNKDDGNSDDDELVTSFLSNALQLIPSGGVKGNSSGASAAFLTDGSGIGGGNNNSSSPPVPTRPNPSLYLDYDRLAVEAYQRGLLPNSTSLSRRDVASALEEAFESRKVSTGSAGEREIAGIKIDEIPLVCPSDTELEGLISLSTAFERRLFPDVAPGRQHQHESAFAEAVRSKKFCNIDVEKLVQNEAVQAVFSKLFSSV